MNVIIKDNKLLFGLQEYLKWNWNQLLDIRIDFIQNTDHFILKC